ncbi:uncharacterized protein LOC143076943 [Mytilus galloprovincialis]|uniref:uncharacterized protein LOC143060275 n=1 Tax=Mytilus galloprovincialis TaxID=29158 RepID=UPI003F7C2B92
MVHKKKFHPESFGQEAQQTTYTCDTCQQVFKRKKQLRDHLSRSHQAAVSTWSPSARTPTPQQATVITSASFVSSTETAAILSLSPSARTPKPQQATVIPSASFVSSTETSEMSKTVDQLLDSWFEVDEIDVKEEVARLEELIRC